MINDKDFSGCHKLCQIKGEHSQVWGGCEFATRPEPTVSMSYNVVAGDGQPALAFDSYTVEELAEDFIEPILRGVRMRLGPELTAAALRGEFIRPFGEEEDGMDLARRIAQAIVRRHEPPERIPIPGIPECGEDCLCRRSPDSGDRP